ncbi:coiled-coil domain-containing protein-domain-containing protein [Microdochium trichocladiopsis]|uniref:Coiled-coil domain-containing protein-domain-containing protein n=1 Tax=Microdochium trichocladiopsis TaxID=1682393 RepID=A0A9P8XRK0_9PEZI|nr:coiled-coil domain-containing protein-domain-containing protein [Microdochium trichocladiopsis]KAH7012663.1 coiled-coil domain-containing protein-domain-containing protein [Microdochium trichocladiopsis]
MDHAPQAPASPPFAQPRPRAPRSPAQSAQVRVRNRRREYLDRNPAYFDSLEHELADPLLYHELIRRFQSPEDREKEGRKKGYSCVLEVDLLRGEAKLTRARAANNHSRQADGHGHATSTNGITQPPPPPGTNGEHVGGAVDQPGVAEIGDRLALPETLEGGRERWRDFLRRRFVLGRDDDFDYRSVDENDDLDALERRDTVEAWFDDEVPGWASDRPEQDDSDDHTMHGAGAQKLAGETGIQDF